MAPKRSGQGPADDGSPSATLKGVNRALLVLEHIARHPGRATAIADAMGLSWATLHRTLRQLEHGGFLQRDPESGHYSIGSRMWFIGATYLANHQILELARRYLLAASRTRGVTVQLVERSDRQTVVLYSSHPDDEITKATYGYHFPLHAGSKGQVLLAFADDAFIDAYLEDDLERLTPFTETDPTALRELLRTIREQRYAVTVADVQLFTGSMAVPVFNHKSQVVACVCFVTRKSTMTNDSRRDHLLEKLLETAQSISLALGWRPELMQAPERKPTSVLGRGAGDTTDRARSEVPRETGAGVE